MRDYYMAGEKYWKISRVVKVIRTPRVAEMSLNFFGPDSCGGGRVSTFLSLTPKRYESDLTLS